MSNPKARKTNHRLQVQRASAVETDELAIEESPGISPSATTNSALSRALTNPRTLTPANILALQQNVGNQAVMRLLKKRQSLNSSKSPAPESPGEVQRYRDYDTLPAEREYTTYKGKMVTSTSRLHISVQADSSPRGDYWNEAHVTFDSEGTAPNRPHFYFTDLGNNAGGGYYSDAKNKKYIESFPTEKEGKDAMNDLNNDEAKPAITAYLDSIDEDFPYKSVSDVDAELLDASSKAKWLKADYTQFKITRQNKNGKGFPAWEEAIKAAAVTEDITVTGNKSKKTAVLDFETAQEAYRDYRALKNADIQGTFTPNPDG